MLAATLLTVSSAAAVRTAGTSRWRATFPSDEQTQPARELLFGEGFTQLVGDRPLHISVMARSGARRPVLPPGLAQVPDPGSMAVSPALASLLRTKPIMRLWLPYRSQATISDDGLASPDQLVAYIGVNASDPSVGPVASFGNPDGDAFGTFGWYNWLGFGLFLVFPAAGLAVVATRNSRTERSRRNQGLRVLGLPAAATRICATTELGVVFAIGAVFGVWGFTLLLPHVHRLPIVNRAFFPHDASPSISAIAVAIGATVLLGMAIGLASAPRERPAGPGQEGSRAKRWLPIMSSSGALFMAGGIAVLYSWLRPQPRSLSLLIGIVLLGAGIPGATRVAASWLARPIARFGARPSLLIAGRRLRTDPRLALRAGGTVGIVVLILGCVQPMINAVVEPTSNWLVEARANGQSSVRGEVDGVSKMSFPPLSQWPPLPDGTLSAIPELRLVTTSPPHATIPLLVADCHQIELFVQQRASCPSERFVLDTGPGRPHLMGTGIILGPSGPEGGQVTVPQAVLDLDLQTGGNYPVPSGTWIVLPSDDPSLANVNELALENLYLRALPTEDGWLATRAWVSSFDPAVPQLINGNEGNAIRDTTPLWVLLGFLSMASIIGLAMLIIAVQDSGPDHRRRALLACGFRRTQLAFAVIVEGSIGGVAAVAVSTIGAIGVSLAYLKLNDEQLQLTPFAVHAAIGLAASVVLVGVLAGRTARRP